MGLNLGTETPHNHESRYNPETTSSTTRQILQVLARDEIPLNPKIGRLLEYGDEFGGSNGNNYTLASRATILRATKHNPTNMQKRVKSVFGLDKDRITADVTEFVERDISGGDEDGNTTRLLYDEGGDDGNTTRLLYDKVDEVTLKKLIELELKEIYPSPGEFNPGYFYPGLSRKRLFELLSSDHLLQPGTRLFLRILYDALYPYTDEDLPSFNREEGTIWDICADSEYYLWMSIVDRTINGAHMNVYYDEDGKPIIVQKKGEYKINRMNRDGQIFSNATGLTLEEIVVNGVRLPPGTIVGLETDASIMNTLRTNYNQAYSTDMIKGVLPLRFSLFALSMHEAKRAFSGHYDKFKTDAGNTGNRLRDLRNLCTENSDGNWINIFRDRAIEVMQKKGLLKYNYKNPLL